MYRRQFRSEIPAILGKIKNDEQGEITRVRHELRKLGWDIESDNWDGKGDYTLPLTSPDNLPLTIEWGESRVFVMMHTPFESGEHCDFAMYPELSNAQVILRTVEEVHARAKEERDKGPMTPAHLR